MKRHLSISTIVAALACMATVPQAQAATYSNGTVAATFLVSLTIKPSCSITASPLTLPAAGALTSVVDGQTTLSVTCTNTTPYNLGLDAGTVTGSTVASRLLKGSAAGNTSTLSVGLFQDAAHATNFGNTQGTDTLGGTGTGTAQSISVFAEVPVQATPIPDTYQTTVAATVYF